MTGKSRHIGDGIYATDIPASETTGDHVVVDPDNSRAEPDGVTIIWPCGHEALHPDDECCRECSP